MSTNYRQSLNYLEFKGGYARIPKEWIGQVIEAYRVRTLVKADLRVFAAILEHRAKHPSSKLDLYRIVNAKAARKGIRRLSRAEISNRMSGVGAVIDLAATGQDGLVRVSRKMARAIASGRCGASEAVVLLYYCSRRMRQNRRMSRLQPDERYARFRYAELSEVSGVTRANLSRAVGRLRDRGLLSTAYVAKQNENALGQVFVDGSSVSLTAPQRPTRASRHEATTALRRFGNTPGQKSTTLINKDPKTRIKKSGQGFGGASWHRDEEILRILDRARAMSEELLEQLA